MNENTMTATTDASDFKLLLTPRDAAKALSISERTLWSLTQRGDVYEKRYSSRKERESD